MIKIKDFGALNDAQKKAIVALLLKYPDQELWELGKNDDLDLSFRIIKHFSSTKPAREQPLRVRYEVMDNTIFAAGAFGKYYRSLFTLSIDKNGQLQIKKRQHDKIRLIKEQQLVELGDKQLTRLRHIIEENNAMLSVSFFHSKPMVKVGNRVFMFMRELPGEELFNIIQRNELSIRERYQLTLALLQAVHEQIHLNGRVHRDLKPENILVYRDGERFIIYIIDYGFIKNIAYDDTSDHLGSRPYSAPECIQKVIKTIKTDIYALGVILLFLWGSQFDKHLSSLFSLMSKRPACPEEITNILASMLRTNMESRPEIPELIQSFHDLEYRLEPQNPLPPDSTNTYSIRCGIL